MRGEGGNPLPPPNLSIFFKRPPTKTNAPPTHGVPPNLKMNPHPSEKQTLPHWNMKHPSMKWFLEKAQ